mmetsp:Transcript_17560/g.40536  ORF Transcript_17560/g.40536 Transcript_17560/m.40536 type:complete len:267 (-) Transcript_17560:90-890(-)
MLVPPLLDLLERTLELLDLWLQFYPLESRDLVPRVPADGDHLPVVEVHDLPRVLEKGRGIAGNEPLPLAHPKDEGAAQPRGDHEVRVVPGADADAVGPHHLRERLPDRLLQCERGNLLDILDELDEHLCVRVRIERVPLALQRLLERREVLDDAVVNQGEAFVRGDVGVRVPLVGLAVGSPASVSDSTVSFDGGSSLLELLDLADPLLEGDVALSVDNGYSRRIISPVFQPGQAPQKHLCCLFRPKVPRDSAHAVSAALLEFSFLV